MPVECAGVPRDLGVAQGLELAWPIRFEVGASRAVDAFRLRLRDDLERLDRDLWCHHPQLAERMRGMAVAARASRRGLIDALARAAREPGPGLALAVARDGHAPLLVRTFPGGREADRPALRLDKPEAGIAALVAAPAWLPTSVCGVNTDGLAVAVSEPEAPAAEDERFQAPPLVLVGDCLQRFSTVEGALSWCERRPTGGAALIVAADAGGALGGIHCVAAGRERVEPVDGAIVSGTSAAAGAIVSGTSAAAGAIVAACREAAGATPEDVACAASEAASGALALVLDPASGTLHASEASMAPIAFRVEGG